MAQSKPPPPGRSSGNRPTGSKSTPNKATARKPAAKPNLQKTPVGRPPVRKPPPRKGKSIVNQKQTPWGMIAATVAVVLFAAAVVVVVIVTHKSDKRSASRYTHAEIAAAKRINGVTYRAEPQHNHVPGHIKYDTSPPIG